VSHFAALLLFIPWLRTHSQDGHLSEVYMLTFQKDGALVASGDFSGVGAVWDLRCGKKVNVSSKES